MSTAALNQSLRPLQVYLNDPEVSEIIVNHPGEVWIERAGEMTRYEVPELTYQELHDIAYLTASATEQNINEEHPLLSASLPGGFRIQLVIPPACPQKHIVMSIRRPTLVELTLDDYSRLGAFNRVNGYNNEEALCYLKKALKERKTILVSGGTSSGKTTFLNACLSGIPDEERIITIEDAAELRAPHSNIVKLFFSRGSQGTAKVSPVELLQASLRLRPDRIILGELRGEESYVFLRAINTGHPGSMSTLHADTPKRALEQLAMMVLQAGRGISKTEIREYVDSIIDVIVQLKRDQGVRYVSEIYELHHE